MKSTGKSKMRLNWRLNVKKLSAKNPSMSKLCAKCNGILLLPLLAISSAVFAQSISASHTAVVRGKLEERTAKILQPAAGVLVTLENHNYTSPAVHSGKDGLYYISNIAPGAYTLKVWTNPKRPLSFPVTVHGTLTDIAPVIVAPTSNVKPKEYRTRPR